jgi:hypothetical protein
MDLKSIMSDEKPEDLKKEIVDIFPHLYRGQAACEASSTCDRSERTMAGFFERPARGRTRFPMRQRLPAQNHPNRMATQKSPRTMFDPSEKFEEEKARSPRIRRLVE